MKLERKHRQLIALAIGVLIIGFGLVRLVFNLNIGSKFAEEMSTILAIIAFALLFSGRSAKTDQEKPKDEETKGE